MSLGPMAMPSDAADLEAARRDFPRYQIDVELAVDRRRYIARRIHPGPGPHTLITGDLAELRAELSSIPERALPQRHARSVE